MPKLTAGLKRMMPGYTGLNPDQKYLLTLLRRPDHPKYMVWTLNWGNGKSAWEYMCMLDWIQRFPGILVWFGRTHIKHLYDQNLTLCQQIIPHDIWKYKVYGGNKPEKWVFSNGSIIQFVGFNDPSAKLGGAPGAAFVEEVSEIDLEMWNYIEGRVGRQPGMPPESSIVVGVGNPRGHYPLYRKFVKGEGVAPDERKDYLWMKGDPMANRRNLKPGYYEHMLAAFPEEMKQRFLFGNDDTHAGQIYYDFSHEKHVHEFTWNDRWIPYVGLDFGQVDPTAVVFLGFDPVSGDVYQIAEHYGVMPRIEDHAKRMDEIVESVGFPVHHPEIVKMADSNIREHEGGSGKRLQAYFSEAGWDFEPADKKGALRPGIERIRSLLMPRGGIPKFHIHPRCKHTIEEFWMYEWKTPKNAVEVMKFVEEPRDDYNHAMDALRYATSTMPIAEGIPAGRKILTLDEQFDLVEAGEGTAIIWDPRNQVAANQAQEQRKHHPLLD